MVGTFFFLSTGIGGGKRLLMAQSIFLFLNNLRQMEEMLLDKS